MVSEKERVFATLTLESSTPPGPPGVIDTMRWVAAFTSVASNVLREIGIFNDTVAGTLYMRAKVFTDGKVGYRIYTGDDIEITMSLVKAST